MVDKTIQEIVDTFGLRRPDVERVYQDMLNKITKGEKPNKRQLKEVERLLRLRYKKLYGTMRSKAKLFRGVVVGATDLIDYNELMRRRCLKEKAIDEERAKRLNYINEEGEPIDWRPTIGTRVNKRFRKPIIGHAYSREWFIVCKRMDDSSPYTLSRLVFSDKLAVDAVPPFNTLIEFRANVPQVIEGEILTLRVPRAQYFKKIKDEEMIDIEGFFKYDFNCRPLGTYKDWHEEYGLDYNALFVTQADVLTISPDVHPEFGTRMLVLADASLPLDSDDVIGYAQGFIPITFTEGSRVVLIARTRERKDLNTITLNIYGIVPLSDHKAEGYLMEDIPQELEWIE